MMEDVFSAKHCAERHSLYKNGNKIIEYITAHNLKVITCNKVTYSDISTNEDALPILRFLGIDWLLSGEDSESLFPITILEPLFIPSEIPSYIGVRKQLPTLMECMNFYTSKKKFLKRFFAPLWANITYKEICGLLDIIYKSFGAINTRDLLLKQLPLTKPLGSAVAAANRLLAYFGYTLNGGRRDSIVIDVYRMADLTGNTININWSSKRFNELNMELSYTLAKKNMGKNCNKPLYKTTRVGIGKILNSELEVFNEGYTMCHCIHSCYWHLIKKGAYMAIHLPSKYEENGITLGLVAAFLDSKPILNFDQAYYKYDRELCPEDKDLVRSYLHEHDQELCAIITKYNK